MNPIAKMLIDMAKFYGHELEERQLELYVQVLSSFNPDIVLQAGREYVQNLKNTRFPIPPHTIMAKYLPPELDSKDAGRELALRVRFAITKWGWCNAKPAREYVGDVGWGIIERMGGWVHLCENLGVEIQETTFMAQFRDAAETTHRLGAQGFDPNRPAIEQAPSKPGLESVGDIVKRLVPKKGDSK